MGKLKRPKELPRQVDLLNVRLTVVPVREDYFDFSPRIRLCLVKCIWPDGLCSRLRSILTDTVDAELGETWTVGV